MHKSLESAVVKEDAYLLDFAYRLVNFIRIFKLREQLRNLQSGRQDGEIARILRLCRGILGRRNIEKGGHLAALKSDILTNGYTAA